LQRIPFGFDRLPRSIALDDPRLRCAVVGADTMPLAVGDHTARVAAAIEWLTGLCGDYAPLRRQFIGCYFDFIAAHLDAHRDELAERVKPYDGLYAPEDFLWSALRPLPRGWVPVGSALLPADMVFWDGGQAVAIELSARETEKQRALTTAGVVVLRIAPADLSRLGELLPDSCRRFWKGQVLPASPFRRAIPGIGDGSPFETGQV
jgi:hypothetical protein